MKTRFIQTFVLLIGILGLNLSFAQEPPVYQTVFKGAKRISGYGTLLQELSFGNGGDSQIGTFYSVGAEGGVLLGQRLYFGVFGLSSVAPYGIGRNTTGIENDLMFIQAGFNTGYKLWVNKAIHLNLGVRTAYGHLQQIPEWYDDWDNDSENYPYQSSFALTPHVSVEINFFRWMQVQFGAGWRKVIGENGFDFPSERDLSQTTLQLGVSFGGFAPRNRRVFRESHH